MERVGAALGDGVDAAAGEAALAHVVRRDHELDLLDGVEADRLRLGCAAGRAGGRQPEQVVVHRAVDLHVVVAVVAARHRQRPSGSSSPPPCELNIGLMRDDVGEAAGDRRQDSRPPLEMLSAVPAREMSMIGALPRHFDRLAHRSQLQLEVGRLLCAELDLHVLLLSVLEAAHVRGDVVGADADVEDAVAPVAAGDRFVTRAGAVCTAVTVAPGRTPPCASWTTPARLPVVTVCALLTLPRAATGRERVSGSTRHAGPSRESA